jgi:DNA-binding transcriptional MerR regulator
MIKKKGEGFNIEISDYFQNYKETPFLFEKLKERRFLKTQLDVIYEDFVRWEKHGLLLPNDFDGKHSQKRYSYKDYVWLKIVEQLRLFGFDYKSIIFYRDELCNRISIQQSYEGFNKLSLKDRNKLPKEQIQLILDKEGKYSDDELLDFGYFELLIINAIVNDDKVSLLFFPSDPEFMLPISEHILKSIDEQQHIEFQKYLNMSHASISLCDIMKKFVIKKDALKQKERYSFNAILSNDEHQLLKKIRKKHDTLKTITIRFTNNKMSIIEVQSIKKVALESRLIEHINKGDYSNIEIKTVDGNIVEYTNTQKYKL